MADVVLTAANSDDPKTRYLIGSHKFPVLFENYFIPYIVQDKGFDLVRRTVLENVSLDEILGESVRDE